MGEAAVPFLVWSRLPEAFNGAGKNARGARGTSSTLTCEESVLLMFLSVKSVLFGLRIAKLVRLHSRKGIVAIVIKSTLSSVLGFFRFVILNLLWLGPGGAGGSLLSSVVGAKVVR